MQLVSVVIPCYNHADYVGRAVYSCLRQKYLKEIVIVDDRSSDSSWNQLEQLAKEIPQIKIMSTQINSGAGGARNLGSKNITGDFICFLDADDDFLSGYFSDTIEQLNKYPHLNGIKVGMQFVDENYHPVILPGDPRYTALISSSACNLMLRRSAFEKIGGFPEDERFRGPLGGEDAAFSRAISDFLAPIGYLPEAFYRVHDRPESHLQKFMNNTRVIDSNAFEFINVLPEQQANGLLGRAIDDYLASIKEKINQQD